MRFVDAPAKRQSKHDSRGTSTARADKAVIRKSGVHDGEVNLSSSFVMNVALRFVPSDTEFDAVFNFAYRAKWCAFPTSPAFV